VPGTRTQCVHVPKEHVTLENQKISTATMKKYTATLKNMHFNIEKYPLQQQKMYCNIEKYALQRRKISTTTKNYTTTSKKNYCNISSSSIATL